MSNRSDKRKQEALKRENERLSAESTGDRAEARKPSKLDQEYGDEVLRWTTFLKDPNRDFSRAPMPFSGVAEEGAAGAEEERTALGAMRFGAAGADPNLQAVLKANIGERRAQRKGQALENAVGRYDAMMRGMGADVAARDQARRMGVAGMTTNAGSNALNSWAAFQPRPHWGLTLATAAIGAAGGALTGGLGGAVAGGLRGVRGGGR